ncbi:MAG: SIS domain-containing protein [Anaerolineaceae bacterium]|nr:SIS domain-containing protein [Anaerolineaceae bacterium]
MNYMIEQIKSIPAMLRDKFDTLVKLNKELFTPEVCKPLQRIFITGCGDSHHASINTQFAFQKLTGLPVEIGTAMHMARYQAGFLPQTGPKTNLVIAISVSGEVSRTYEALKMFHEAGAYTVAFTATPESRLASAGDLLFKVPNPPFPSPVVTIVPGVRSFVLNQLALYLMAIQIGLSRGQLSKDEAEAYRKELHTVIDAIETCIQKNLTPAKVLAEKWKNENEYVFIGSGPNFGIALFSAAKILEASGDSALGQDVEEWAHLQYFEKETHTPTILISADERDSSRAAEVLVAAKALGRKVCVFVPEDASGLLKLADENLTFPRVREFFSPLLTQIPGELYAAFRSEAVGEPFFRNFEGGRSIQGGGGISRIRSSETWESWQE